MSGDGGARGLGASDGDDGGARGLGASDGALDFGHGDDVGETVFGTRSEDAARDRGDDDGGGARGLGATATTVVLVGSSHK